MKLHFGPIPAEISREPYCTGGELCSAEDLEGYILQDGTIVHAPDDGSTWSNRAHDGPRRGMVNGTPLPKPEGAIASFSGWEDDIGGRRVSVTVTGPDVRSMDKATAVMAAWIKLPEFWRNWAGASGSEPELRKWRKLEGLRRARRERLAMEAQRAEWARQDALATHAAMRAANKEARRQHASASAMSPMARAMAKAGL